jgi:uncharacterized protein (TIGR00255 family)
MTNLPLRSMTGFARAHRPLGDGEMVVSVKTLNHRSLDVHVHAPSVADLFETAVRSLVKSRLARGQVEVRISLPLGAANGTGATLNHKMLEEYLAAFRQAAAEHKLNAQPDLNAALRIPGMFGEFSEGSELPPGAEAAILDALRTALDELNQFRAREGAEIAKEMSGHNTQLGVLAEQMETIRANAPEVFQHRLAERLKDLLKGAPGVQIDPQRLAQEAAILADRSDIGEELARLKIHSGQLAALLEAGGESGKKIDFLLQEMNRETNTILSKTSGAGEIGLKITELALAAKAAIEKIREQSLNLE